MTAAALLAWALASSAFGTARPAPPELPEDLGPSSIDTSDYPAEHRRAYEEILLPVYRQLKGGPARVLNSPLVEIDPQGERAERRALGAAADDAALVVYTRDGWRMEVVKVKTRPPCCGSCPILSKEDARALRDFLVYDSLRRKTGPAARDWIEHRRRLIRRFADGNLEVKP